ncbi:MAG: hypothetical protein HQL77_16445 [Magnetococcales bacterium]|nr:hypothetical protein [Magnetococcales bacterium]
MIDNLAERIQDQMSRLPEPLMLEVLDFIGYLEHRYGLVGPDVLRSRHAVQCTTEQAIAAFRGSGKGGGTERLLSERRSDLGQEA